MAETAIVALTTFFATIGPLDVAGMFAAMTVRGGASVSEGHGDSRGTLIATVILVTFAILGEVLLDSLGISLAAFRTAGGVLLFLIGLEMVFARSSGAASTTDEETAEGVEKHDISVFPLATPLIAGRGAMGAAILLMADTEGDTILQVIVVGALLLILLVTLTGMLLARHVHRVFGVTGMQVISRVVGVLLCALAVQFVFDGIAQSGLYWLTRLVFRHPPGFLPFPAQEPACESSI